VVEFKRNDDDDAFTYSTHNVLLLLVIIYIFQIVLKLSGSCLL